MDNLENTYNQALEMIKNGRSKEEVLLHFSKQQKELAPLLKLSSALLSMPKNTAPAPAMQRKYALAPSKSFWLNWIHISKFASVSMSAILLISAFAATGYAAKNSTAGQTLFSVKKFAEKVELNLANNQNEKANIQLAITQQRLSDAQEIFSNPSSNVEQKTAVLNELTDQTNNAVALVDKAAKNDPSQNQSNPLVNSLQNITQQQKTLLTQIKPDSQIQKAADTALLALNANAKQLSEIKQSMVIAGSEQTLAKIKDNPNSVTVLGMITQISGSQITVEKNNVFTIGSQTSILDEQGNATTTAGLNLSSKVNIIGVKSQTATIAQQITIIQPTASTSTQPQVKSASTQTASNTHENSSTTAEQAAKKYWSDPAPSLSATAQSNSGTAFGTFILEDPNPQFVK